MEELLVKIGELIAIEIDEVNEIKYLDKETGYLCMLMMKDGNKLMLSLV